MKSKIFNWNNFLFLIFIVYGYWYLFLAEMPYISNLRKDSIKGLINSEFVADKKLEFFTVHRSHLAKSLFTSIDSVDIGDSVYHKAGEDTIYVTRRDGVLIRKSIQEYKEKYD